MSGLTTAYNGTDCPRHLDHLGHMTFDEDIAARARGLVVEMPEEP